MAPALKTWPTRPGREPSGVPPPLGGGHLKNPNNVRGSAFDVVGGRWYWPQLAEVGYALFHLRGIGVSYSSHELTVQTQFHWLDHSVSRFPPRFTEKLHVTGAIDLGRARGAWFWRWREGCPCRGSSGGVESNGTRFQAQMHSHLCTIGARVVDAHLPAAQAQWPTGVWGLAMCMRLAGTRHTVKRCG